LPPSLINQSSQHAQPHRLLSTKLNINHDRYFLPLTTLDDQSYPQHKQDVLIYTPVFHPSQTCTGQREIQLFDFPPTIFSPHKIE
jgi:hypothetical protein